MREVRGTSTLPYRFDLTSVRTGRTQGTEKGELGVLMGRLYTTTKKTVASFFERLAHSVVLPIYFVGAGQ